MCFAAVRAEVSALERFWELPEKLRYFVLRALSARLGWEVGLHTDDRRVLEGVVLPYFAARPDVARVLFVGCDWYTRGCERLFAGREYWTIDKDERQRIFGARRHVTDRLAELGRYFEGGSLDLMICNGVVGWGLDDREEAQRSFAACHTALRTGGVLVLGWNDVPRRLPFPVEATVEEAGFRAHVFPPLGSARHLTQSPNRHTYSFYVK